MNKITRETLQGVETLRHELIVGALAARTLPLLPTGGPGMAMLPGQVRQALRRLPHLAVGVFAVVLFWLSWSLYGDAFGNHPDGAPGLSVLLGATAAAPLLLVLFRPIAAWWLSLVGICVVVASNLATDPWPFAETTFASHLTVMVLVALRSPPVVAAVMWMGTTATFSCAVWLVHRPDQAGNNVAVFAVWSAITLIGAVLVRAWQQARGRAAASHDVTLTERSKRTALEERTTIARELHDVVTHHMAVIAIQAEAAPYRLESIPPELGAAFATIRENAVAALDELRRVLGVIRLSDHETYDAPEAPQPTLGALDGLLANVREAGLPVDKVVTGAVRALPRGVELSAYRIIQEALSNALRHAPGTATRVELAHTLGGLGVRIVNGPAPADATSGGAHESAPGGSGSGHGITGMRERVAMLGGEMTAGPTSDGGYEVAAFLPTPGVSEQPSAAEGIA